MKDLEWKYFAKHANLFPIAGESYFISLLIILCILYLCLFVCFEGFCVMALTKLSS